MWRAEYRRAQRAEHRSGVLRRRGQRGQSLVIFVLSLTVLIGLAGLAVDVVRAYDLYARELRAAEAGALAGVAYMPNYYNTAYPKDGTNDCAITRALKEVNKNGTFAPTVTSCLGGVPSPTPNTCNGSTTVAGVAVTVCKVTGNSDALQVTVNQNLDLYLLSALGFATIKVTATAQASYIAPLLLGEGDTTNLDSYFFGNAGSCSNGNGTSSGCNSSYSNFAAAINGPAELKEIGDPYVNCEEGPSTLSANSNAPDTTWPSTGNPPYQNTTTGWYTNHAQWGSAKCGLGTAGNPDSQPGGYSGAATSGTSHPGGYNYALIPTTKSDLWLFNPGYIPYVASGKSCPGSTQVDGFVTTLDCSKFYDKYPNVTNALQYDTGTKSYFFDDPRFYFNVTYTLYGVSSPLDRSSDTQLWTYTFRPYDAMPADLAAHGCSSSQVYDFSTGSHYPDLPIIPALAPGGCVSIPNGTNAQCQVGSNGLPTAPCQYQWFEVANQSTGQPIILDPLAYPNGYRLVVEATSYGASIDPGKCGLFTCGWGWHSYGVQICSDPTTGGPVKGCTTGGRVSPWNNFALRIIPSSSTTTNIIPIGTLDSSLAGRTISISIFDPGDSMQGNAGDAYATIAPPTGWGITPSYAGLRTATLTNPCPYPTKTCPVGSYTWVQTSSSGDYIYNGLWITMQIKLPSTYAPDLVKNPSSAEWYLALYASHGNSFDEVTVSVSLLGGSPIHLNQ